MKHNPFKKSRSNPVQILFRAFFEMKNPVISRGLKDSGRLTGKSFKILIKAFDPAR